MIDFNKEEFELEEDENKEVEGQTEGTEKEKKAHSAVWEFFSWLIYFAVAIIVALLIKNYLIINANVPTGSMENTIMPGDRLIGNRLAYLNSDPERGDIIIFRFPDDEEQIYVKRVIGLPGETVTIEAGKVYINGSYAPLVEDYLKETWEVATGPYTFEIPENSYLVMGDNRNGSWDARYWDNTYVTKDKILGKAVFTYWPYANWGKLE